MEQLLITGANRGLGLELTHQYLQSGAAVMATSRAHSDRSALLALQSQFKKQLTLVNLDVTDEQSIEALARQLKSRPIDMLINNAGLYGPKDERKDLEHLDLKLWQSILTTNTIAPLLLTSALLPCLRAGQGKKIIFLSSTYASITKASATAGSYYYTSSKAGMNMTVKKLSDELASEGFICIAVSPGWVQTEMGGAEAELTPEQSIHRVRTILDQLKPADNGGFFSSKGTPLPW